MIERSIAPLLRRLASQYPVITLTGPRQSGKTTLTRSVFPGKPYFTLEDPDTRRYATEDPRGFLTQHVQGAILDEIQRAPELAPYLQGMVDADPQPGRVWRLARPGPQRLAGAFMASTARQGDRLTRAAGTQPTARYWPST